MEDLVDIILAIVFIVIPIVLNSAIKKDKKKAQRVANQVNQSMRQSIGDMTNAQSNRATWQQNVANQQMRQAQRPQQAPNIVERAKQNNAKLSSDTTLEQIEKMHGHAEHHEPEKVQHNPACQSIGKDDRAIVAEESVLGTIEDLMVKGYDGNLNFDRDFVGEAMDMVAAFTVPDTFPEYESPKMSI